MAQVLEFTLSNPVRQMFARDVEAVLTLDRGANVAEFLGSNPWGDLAAYRRQVYNPMQSGQPSAAHHAQEAVTVSISIDELPRANAVLHELYEGYAGGRPWSGVNGRERAIFESLAAQLSR